MNIIKRKAALGAGLPRYFTGKPCKNGHIDERDAASGRCISCIRELAADSYSRNRSAILDGIRKRRVEDNDYAAKARASARRYYHQNRENVAAYVRESRGTDEYRARRRQAYASSGGKYAELAARWRAMNPVRVKDSGKRFRQNNKGNVNAKNAARQAHIKTATPPWADLEKIRAIYDAAASAGLEVDHIVPLRGRLVCGLHCEANLRAIEPEENRRKTNSFDPMTFAHELPV